MTLNRRLTARLLFHTAHIIRVQGATVTHRAEWLKTELIVQSEHITHGSAERDESRL